MKKRFLISISFLITLFLFSCANQIPPSGGKDDKTPPEIIYVSPKPGKLNFRGNTVSFRFDEYVDRRSFEESFYISPKPKGEISFDWSGKDVDVKFSGKFEKDRTYVVTVGKELKDVRGGNPAGSSYTFAFSTGGKLDRGIISGRVYADNFERIKVLAFIKDGKTEAELNPALNTADYITQPDEEGYFIFTNLPANEFELYAITDEDRNNLYNKVFESVSLLKNPVKLFGDSALISNADFLLKTPLVKKSGNDFLKELEADSSGNIYSNIFRKDEVIPNEYIFYFYFKNNSYSKSEIVNNFSITDSVKGTAYRTVFNWINDSLLEVFSNEKFPYSADLQIRLTLTGRAKNIYFYKNLKTAGRNNSGTVSGKFLTDELTGYPVNIYLINKERKFISYFKKLSDSADFRFDDVLEGNYTLFSYTDENSNGIYDMGSIDPYTAPEVFRFYNGDIKVKGGWNIDNIFIKY